jgi:dTDP-4-amino-4,6-dideoxygalactose transaminase
LTTRIPLVDVGAQFRAHESEWLPLLVDALRSGRFVGGAPVEEFEREFASYVGSRFAVGVGSGADALRLSLEAIGLRTGDRVATVSHTFVSTADAIVHNGAHPRFVDIDPVSYTMDPEDLARKMDASVRAIIVVHLYGQPAAMDRISEIAAKWGVPVLEDVAQAHGARFQGRRCGSLGRVGCFSFYPAKNLGALGDAGAVTTDDPEVAEQLRLLRDNGAVQKYRHVLVGYNTRLDTIQAVILRAKLAWLDRWNDARRDLARRYRERLAAVPGLTLPPEVTGTEAVYHLFVVRTAARDALQLHLAERGVETGVHYPIPIHRQPSYASVPFDGLPLPVTEMITPGILSLPMYPELAASAVEEVAEMVAQWRPVP